MIPNVSLSSNCGWRERLKLWSWIERSYAGGVRGVFDEPARGTYWIAVENGKILGVLLAIPEWSDWRNATVLWIHSLYIIPEARRRGVFKMLYRNLEKQIKKSPELAGIRLYVDKTNHSAQRIYQKLGMSKEHYDLYEWLK